MVCPSLIAAQFVRTVVCEQKRKREKKQQNKKKKSNKEKYNKTKQFGRPSELFLGKLHAGVLQGFPFAGKASFSTQQQKSTEKRKKKMVSKKKKRDSVFFLHN
jgi:hypothetical protein